jgi:hypothetical protein
MMDEIYRQTYGGDDEDKSIDDLIDGGATIIPLADGQVVTHPEYAPAHVEIDGKEKHFLIKQQAAISINRDGSDDPDIGLMETTKAYCEFKERVERPNMDKGESDPADSIVGTKIQDAHDNYLVTKLVRGKEGNTKAEFDDKTLKELGFKDKYVSDRLEAMAMSALGVKELPESGGDLTGIIEHVDKAYMHTEKIEGKEFERVFCYAGSHWRVRDDYRGAEGEEVEADSMSRSVRSGRRRTPRKRIFQTFTPDVQKYEEEIIKHLREKGKLHPDTRNLARTYVNLKHILPNDKSKALPTYPNDEAYERYTDDRAD